MESDPNRSTVVDSATRSAIEATGGLHTDSYNELVHNVYKGVGYV